jgi:chemotaxis protein CheD
MAQARRLEARAADRPSVYLHAGQVFASGEPCEVSTVVGSCVAVMVIDPEQRVGGACHYLLPFRAEGQLASPRFGEAAISEVVARVLALGARAGCLEAKVFGGASTLGGERAGAASLGAKNVEVARRFLEEHGIPIVAEDVGGTSGRKLIFLPDEGHVWVKRL